MRSASTGRCSQGRRFQRPWLLAGGLTPDNLVEAVRISGAPMVDVSSGVEDRPGEKNVSKIKAFLDASQTRLGRSRALTFAPAYG